MSTAAAEVLIHLLDDLLPRRLGVLLQQAISAHDHPGGAEAALKGALIDEGLLQGMELSILLQPFNADEVLSFDAGQRGLAGANRDAIDGNGAGAADAEA